jgi:translation elongation factor EF-1alpha
MICEIKVLYCQNIITEGFECIIHYCGNEYEISIDKILKEKILKKREKGKCIITSKKPIIVKYLSRRFILRDATNTIGYGIINKVKK